MADTGSYVGVGSFYVSFMLIVALVLVNVVIAVLLDEFSKVSLSWTFFLCGGWGARATSLPQSVALSPVYHAASSSVMPQYASICRLRHIAAYRDILRHT